MAIKTDYHNNKHHLRHHVVPDRNEGLDIGLGGQRFHTGRFRALVADTLDVITLTVSAAVTIVTSLTLSFLGAGVLHSDSSGVITSSAVNLSGAADVTGDLPLANIVQGTALSVLGVAGNSAADYADIVAAADKRVLRREGTAVAFGAVDLTSSSAVTGALAVANGGTGSASASAARTALGTAPLDATFVTLSTNTELSNERVLTAGTGIALTDGGAGSTVTVAAYFTNPISYQVFGG